LSYSINVINSAEMEIKNYNNSFSVITEKWKKKESLFPQIYT
jgi:hypothetical protein